MVLVAFFWITGLQFMIISTAQWSLRPGLGVELCMIFGWLVMHKSSIFFFLVGNFMTCSRLLEFMVLYSILSENDGVLLLSVDRLFQFALGKLKSPHKITIFFLAYTNNYNAPSFSKCYTIF